MPLPSPLRQGLNAAAEQIQRQGRQRGAQPLASVTDPKTGVTFPDLNARPFGGEQFQTNLIMPEPCDYLSESLPECSVIRPSTTRNSGAVAAVRAFTADGLFRGQSEEFLETIMALAVAADAARRDL